MSRTSIALGNLRAFTILLVVSFHSVLAYLASKPAPLPFTAPPFAWRAFPIADPGHWFGFDLYCAFQYVFLMPFMFFLSGLFVWPSLRRKGAVTFTLERVRKIGLPFILGVGLLMLVAHYPEYAQSALNPSWREFWAQLLSLPIWPSGPLWFLWQLLVLDLMAAALYRFAPALGDRLGAVSARAADRSFRYFLFFVVISALAYLPFAAFFRPWDWDQIGPFAFQPGRVLHQAVYFFAGFGVGAGGIESGLLRSDGPLARRWALWTSAAIAAFVAWMLMTALTMDEAPLGVGPFPRLNIGVNLVFALSSGTACFALAGMFLRFAGRRSALADDLAKHAYAIFVLHYLFVVWMQYVLLGLTLPPAVKAAIVFGTDMTLSWIAAAAAHHAREGLRRSSAALKPS